MYPAEIEGEYTPSSPARRRSLDMRMYHRMLKSIRTSRQIYQRRLLIRFPLLLACRTYSSMTVSRWHSMLFMLAYSRNWDAEPKQMYVNMCSHECHGHSVMPCRFAEYRHRVKPL
jgi:hypothetical protein